MKTIKQTVVLVVLALTLQACAAPYANGPRRTPFNATYSHRLEARNWCKSAVEARLRQRIPDLSEEVLVHVRTSPEYIAATLDCMQFLGWV